MKDIDWNILKSFSFVVEYGSLSGAARALNTTQPTIGRHIDSLEFALNTSLFIRSRDGLIPTEDALDILPEVKHMLGSYLSLIRKTTGDIPEVGGTVRVTMSEVMGAYVLPKIFYRFSKLYPAINLEMSISNKVDNLLKREADIAIRMTEPTQNALITKKIGVVEVGFFAHKNYLKTYGTPTSLNDFKNHKLIGPDNDHEYLKIMQSYGLDITRENLHYRLDNQLVQVELLRNSLGICPMQLPLAKREKDLHEVLPKKIKIPMPIWVAMHEDLRASKRVRLVYDFLKVELENYLKE